MKMIEIFYRVAEINPVYDRLPGGEPGPGWIYSSNEINDFDVVGEVALKIHSRGYKFIIDEITRVTGPDGHCQLFTKELQNLISLGDGKGFETRQ